MIKDTLTRIIHIHVTDNLDTEQHFLAVRHTDTYKACDYVCDEQGHVVGGSAGIFNEYVTLYNDCFDETESVTVHEYPKWRGELCDAYCEKGISGWDFKDEHGIISSMVADALGYGFDEITIELHTIQERDAAA